MIELDLPAPWSPGTRFTLPELPKLTWLVGPNGTGKSRFLRMLRDHPEITRMGPRLVSTDRLSGTRTLEATRVIWGDRIAKGLPKAHFDHFLQANRRDGAIVGVLPLLYQRPDLRMRVEATLSQLLDRQIKLDMTDGNLTPKVRCGKSPEYGMFTDECHGVLELVVLLANIYDKEARLLLIDEPEQHLHPQYQAFVLEELRREGKKAVLATHSPSFLSVKTLEDLRGVICFHSDFAPPSRYSGDPHIDPEVKVVLPRMTDQHRGFFFADSPVFVEGYYDAILVAGIQRGLGHSCEAAGSCLIPSMGKDDAERYLMLCSALGKRAVFLFDLDALFDRRMTDGATRNAVLESRVAGSGHGRFAKLLGELQRTLTDAVKTIEAVPDPELPSGLQGLRQMMQANREPQDLEKRRIAVLVALAERNADVRAVLSAPETLKLEGLRGALLDHLASVHVHVLPGGSVENYLPEYSGDRFIIPDAAKRQASESEQCWLASGQAASAVLARYGELGQIVAKLPSRRRVDIRPILRIELANVLHKVTMSIRSGKLQRKEDVETTLGEDWRLVANFVDVSELDVESDSKFSGVLRIRDKFGIGECECRFDHRTLTSDPEALDLKERGS